MDKQRLESYFSENRKITWQVTVYIYIYVATLIETVD